VIKGCWNVIGHLVKIGRGQENMSNRTYPFDPLEVLHDAPLHSTTRFKTAFGLRMPLSDTAPTRNELITDPRHGGALSRFQPPSK
jgi:hypothetical protein